AAAALALSKPLRPRVTEVTQTGVHVPADTRVATGGPAEAAEREAAPQWRAAYSLAAARRIDARIMRGQTVDQATAAARRSAVPLRRRPGVSGRPAAVRRADAAAGRALMDDLPVDVEARPPDYDLGGGVTARWWIREHRLIVAHPRPDTGERCSGTVVFSDED